jgi:hypothetical protein
MHITATLDTSYQAVRVYSIHYLELNQTPVVKLIYDSAINGSSALSIIDDGVSFIAEYSVQDLLAISPLPYIPNTLAVKRDRLFIGNYTLNNFNPTFDARAYSYPTSNTSTSLTNSGSTTSYTKAQLDALASTNDAINPDYDTYQYKYNSPTQGGTGKNIEYEFVLTTIAEPIPYEYIAIPPKSLKKFEVYRIGIMFYNTYGQRSPVKWVADFRVPDLDTGGMSTSSTGIKINLTASGVTALLTAGAVGYQLCIVERKQQDRTILSQGFLVPSVRYTINGTGTHVSEYFYPYYTPKQLSMAAEGIVGDNISNDYVSGVDWKYTASPDPYPDMDTSVCFFYSTDTIFETSSMLPTSVRILGEVLTGTSDQDTVRRLFENDILVYQELTHSNFPYWGASTETRFPLHIMDQSPSIVAATPNIYNYEVVRTFYYNAIFKNAYSITTLVAPATGKWVSSEELSYINSTHTVSNIVALKDLVDVNTAALPTSYYGSFSNCIALDFGNETWHLDGSSNRFGLFDAAGLIPGTRGTTTTRAIPIVELLQTVSNQYGGNTYEIKQSNEYLPLGNLRPIDTTQNSEYIGDIWIGMLSVNRFNGGDNKTQGQMNLYEFINVNYIENNHNVYARQDDMFNSRVNLSVSVNYRYNRISDNHKLLGAYNQVPNVFKNYPVPFNYSSVDKYPLSIMGSNVKTPNELLDSWLVFPPTNTKLLEGTYGTLAKLHNLAGDLIALQTTGIALIEIEPRVQTTGQDGLGIYLGIGDLFYYHKYLVTNTGTTNKFTVCDDGKNLYYYDNTLNLICTLHEGKLSTLKSIKTILDAYPTGPHRTTYFNKMDYVYFQYTGFTLVYDLLLQKFISKDSFLDSNKALIPIGKTLHQLEEGTGSLVNLYTQLTGAVKASKIVYLICPEADFEKVFHNLQYRLNGTDFTTVKVTNDISASAVTTPDTKIKFDIHRIHLPRVLNSRERFRGIYIFVELNNTGNYSLDDMIILYNTKG